MQRRGERDWLRRAALGATLLAASLGAFGCHGGEKFAAQERMRKILLGLQGKGEIDQAVCLWAHGSLRCPGGMDDFQMSATTLEQNLKAKGINAFAEVKSFEVGEATYERGDGGMFKISPVVQVRIKINGSPLAVRCIDGEVVTWVDCPECVRTVAGSAPAASGPAPSGPAPAGGAPAGPGPAGAAVAPVAGQAAAGKAAPAPSARPVLAGPQLFALVSPAVLVVETYDKKGNKIKQGSAVSIDKNLAVTNWHVISKGATIKVLKGKEHYDATVDAVLEERDLARLKIETELTPVAFAEALPNVGETTFALGAPFGFELTISEGILSGKREDDRDHTEYLQTTAAISPGSSGGGLFNTRGELLGVTTAQVRLAQNLNFALPASYVRELMKLPPGSMPAVEVSLLEKLGAADRKWLTAFSYNAANLDREFRYSAKEMDRARALIASLGTLEEWEKQSLRFDLGGGMLQAARAFWEDAVYARTFKKFAKSRKRVEIERKLLKRGLVTEAQLKAGDDMMTGIAEGRELVLEGITLVADERVLSFAMEGVARRESLVEKIFWQP